ncbi:MAG: contractile injection system tape measure protein [Bacteroidota bacterium]
MRETVHIIDKVFLEINTSQVNTANSLTKNIDGFLKDELFPKIEYLLDLYDNPDAVIRFDEFNIDLSVKDVDSFNGMQEEILRRMEEQLAKKVTKSSAEKYSDDGAGEVRNLSRGKNHEEIFLFFLANGYYPWYGNGKQIREFEKRENWQKSFDNKFFIQKLEKLLQSNRLALLRFVSQFSDEMVAAFFTKMNPFLSELGEKRIQSLLKALPHQVKSRFLEMIIIVSAETNAEKITDAFYNWFRVLQRNVEGLEHKTIRLLAEASIFILKAAPADLVTSSKFQPTLDQLLSIIKTNQFSDNLIPELPQKPDWKFSENENITENANFADDSINERLVENGGLVILHPFLKHFFTVIKVIDEHGKISTENRDLAVQALHFLATGQENSLEGNLVFEKFLCGIPLKMPVQRQSLLTPEIRNEAEEMLKEAIKNWPALKNTSPDGLRQMFLQREGKLLQDGKKYKLLMERKPQDALLDKLEWSISIVKLPLRKELLFVEW